MQVNVKICRVKSDKTDIPLPQYETAGSAGMDIRADINEAMVLKPKEICLVPTGLAISLENGYECQVRSRSGLAAKYGIFALNAPGTIDSDYRGEIKVILANFGDKSFRIERSDRIAQLVVAKYEKVRWIETDSLDETRRGSDGFGSTGID